MYECLGNSVLEENMNKEISDIKYVEDKTENDLRLLSLKRYYFNSVFYFIV